MEREAVVTEQPRYPRPAVTLTRVSVTERALRANLVTATLPATSSDGSESVGALATGPPFRREEAVMVSWRSNVVARVTAEK